MRKIIIEIQLDTDNPTTALRQLSPLPRGAQIVGMIGPEGGRVRHQSLQELLATARLGQRAGG